MTEPQPNRMIVIDGVDGSGKGVQSRRLHQALLNAGLPAILTREPGGSPAAEQIRDLLVSGEPEKWDDMSELLLMYAARRAHLRDTVWPALAAGKWVVSDRYADSSRAFQGAGGELGLELAEQLPRLAIGDFEPALVIILDLPESVALERARKRGGGEDRFEKKGGAYHGRVRNAFLQIAAGDTERYRVVAADPSMDEVAGEIVDLVNRRFALKLAAVRDIS